MIEYYRTKPYLLCLLTRYRTNFVFSYIERTLIQKTSDQLRPDVFLCRLISKNYKLFSVRKRSASMAA